MKKYFCLCCGYKTLIEKPPGTYEICEICYWEDDIIEGGANKITLRQAKRNFKEFGVSDLDHMNKVRQPIDTDERHLNWECLYWPVDKNKSIYAILPKYKTNTGSRVIDAAEYPVNKELLGKPAIYIIEDDNRTAFMNSYTINGGWIGDTWHFNYDDAKHQAEYEYGEHINNWKDIPDNIENLIEYVLTQIPKK